MQRPPGSPPAPASDLLPSSPSPSSSSSSCSDPPRPRVPRPYGLRKLAMPRERRRRRRRRASWSRTHHTFHQHTPLPPGCPGRPTRLLQRWSGATCGAATTTSRETCAGGNSSPTRSSSSASTRKEKSTAPKVRTIRTVSGAPDPARFFSLLFRRQTGGFAQQLVVTCVEPTVEPGARTKTIRTPLKSEKRPIWTFEGR